MMKRSILPAVFFAVLILSFFLFKTGETAAAEQKALHNDDPLLNFYNTYLTGWDDLAVDYSMDPEPLDEIGSKLKKAGWKFWNMETLSNTQDVYIYYDSRMDACFETADSSCNINLYFIYWGHGAQPWLEIKTDVKKNAEPSSLDVYRKAVKGFLPDKVIELLGMKTAEELGFTDSFISSLKSRAEIISENEFYIGNYGDGITDVIIYSFDNNFHMQINTELFSFETGWQKGQKIDNLMIKALQ